MYSYINVQNTNVKCTDLYTVQCLPLVELFVCARNQGFSSSSSAFSKRELNRNIKRKSSVVTKRERWWHTRRYIQPLPKSNQTYRLQSTLLQTQSRQLATQITQLPWQTALFSLDPPAPWSPLLRGGVCQGRVPGSQEAAPCPAGPPGRGVLSSGEAVPSEKRWSFSKIS